MATTGNAAWRRPTPTVRPDPRRGARVNNLQGRQRRAPEAAADRRSPASPARARALLVFGTIAAESQRLINETYSAFVQGFMPTLARPDVDVLDGLTTAIIVDQQRLGADTALDASAPPPTPTRCCGSSSAALGKPHDRLAQRVRLQRRRRSERSGGITVEARRQDRRPRVELQPPRRHVPALRGPRRASPTSTCPRSTTTTKSLNEGALTIPGYSMDGWRGRIFRGCGFFDPDKPIPQFTRKSCTTCSTRSRRRSRSRINLTYRA